MPTLEDLPPLREVVAAHGLAARKSFGQHFLFDLNLTARIARAAGDLTEATVFEVGPGPGGLTRALLAADAAEVVAVEADPRFAPALEEVAAAAPGRLTVIEADARRVDWAALAAERPGRAAKLVANLPYNVGTNLLIGWLTGPPWWASLTLMFQREVADRIVAAEGTEAYGRLAVLAALRARAALVLTAPARAFTPPPKVDSAVVHLTPRADAFADADGLARVTAAAFGQRRKMLRRSLRALTPDPDALLAEAGVPGEARPETVPPAGFAALAQAWRGGGD